MRLIERSESMSMNPRQHRPGGIPWHGRARLVAASLLASGVATATAFGGTPPEVPPQHATAPPTIADFDAFGASVAIEGTTAVVGARGLDQGGSNRGGAWVLSATGSEWTTTAQLIPVLADPGDEFGAAVAIAGNLAFLGSLDDRDADDDSGDGSGDEAPAPFVAVFKEFDAAWTEAAGLTASIPKGSGFGSAIAADGDVVVVGAPLLDLSIRDEGGAFIFRRIGSSDEFVLEASLIAPDAFENDRFGSAVAISGDRVVVGMPRDDDAGIDGGAAWIFERVDGDWLATAKIIRTTSDWYAGFGSAVAIDGDVLAIGAPRDDLGGTDDGAVRVYRRLDAADWMLEAVIVAGGETATGRETGDAVALDGDRLVIGLPTDSQMGSNAGAAATWTWTGEIWTPEAEIRAADVTGLALLGAAVAADDGRVLLGVPVTSAFGQYAGGLASLDLRTDCDSDGTPDYIAVTAGNVPDCNENGQPDSCDLEQGLDTDCNANGIPDGCELADGSELDCDSDGVLDSCQIAEGLADDCNGNGLIDDCELEDGTAEDCNGNGVIDTCEFADGTAEDCDANGVIDSCEIADGTAEDLDRDGVVDACQDFLVFDVPGRFNGIAKAIAIAPSGSLISVGPGTYNEAIDFQGKALRIEGDVDDPASVIIDGDGLDTSVVRVVSGEGQDSILRGVTIRNGSTGSLFKDLGALVGGGLYTFESSPLVEDCIFEGNSAVYGGAIYARRGTPIFRRCVFLGNGAEVDGGAFHFSRTDGGVLEDCVFNGNDAGNYGGAIHLFDGTPTVINASIAGNMALEGGGVSWASFGGSATIQDSAIEENLAFQGAGVMITQPTVDLTLIGTTVCENTPDQLIGEYLDGGENTVCPNVDCNLNGLEDADEIADGLVSDCNDNGVIDDCEIADGTEADLNLDGILDTCQGTLTFDVPGVFSSITDAIDAAPDGSIIALAAGTYNETLDFGSKNLVVQGDASDPSSIVLDGDGLETSVVSMADGQNSTSMLVGLTITNGSIGSPLPGQPTNRGGGGIFLRNASPIIQDCIFSFNTSGFGGAAYLRNGSPRFEYCTFIENIAATDGGAIFSSNADGVIASCTILANEAVNHGGGIKVVLGGLSLLDTEIAGNHAYQGGGIFWFANEDTLPLQVSNCTITENVATDTGGGIKGRLGFPGVLLEGSTVCDNAPDEIDGEFIDAGGNTLCICIADFTGDGFVSGADLGILLSSWGPCVPGAPCLADLTGDGFVTGADLGLLLGAWGVCP